jgi:hypothetical protein
VSVREEIANQLAVVIDGATVGLLLVADELMRHDAWFGAALTPAQRSAVSACWSAALRAKVADSTAADAERERNRVVVDVEPW